MTDNPGCLLLAVGVPVVGLTRLWHRTGNSDVVGLVAVFGVPFYELCLVWDVHMLPDRLGGGEDLYGFDALLCLWTVVCSVAAVTYSAVGLILWKAVHRPSFDRVFARRGLATN